MNERWPLLSMRFYGVFNLSTTRHSELHYACITRMEHAPRSTLFVAPLSDDACVSHTHARRVYICDMVWYACSAQLSNVCARILFPMHNIFEDNKR